LKSVIFLIITNQKEEYMKKSGLSEQQALTVVETVEEMSAEERETAFTGIIVICYY
jgi:hypothetical protein